LRVQPTRSIRAWSLLAAGLLPNPEAREERQFEETVARLSIEPHVTAVGWELVEQQRDISNPG
jgi:hypothetical protein